MERAAFEYKGSLAGMAAFKEHCRFGFWKGSLLKGSGMDSGAAFDQFGRITSLADLPGERELITLVKQAAALNDEGVKAPRMKKAARVPLEAPPPRKGHRLDRRGEAAQLEVHVRTQPSDL